MGEAVREVDQQADMAKLRFEGLTKRFGPVTAVDNVSLEISSGEFVTLVGASGCGKTTLLRMIAGFTAPDAGRLWIDERRVEGLPPRLRNIGFVFQSYALFPTMTVAGNIDFGLRIRRRPKREVASKVAELCEMTRLNDMENRYPHELSGGQQQRVALARALSLNPAILLLDEPLSALDAKIRVLIRAELRSVVTRLGITTVYVTHDQEEALSISDRVVVMDQGRFFNDTATTEIYTNPKSSFVANFIGTSNRLQGTVLPDGRVGIEGKPLDVKVPQELLDRERCLICVRPPHIELSSPDDCSLPLEGVLDTFSFLGQTVRVVVTTNSGASLQVDIESTKWLELALEPGSPVRWWIETGRAMIFADEGDWS
jgi:putative spermidine/putrescine transport system ATP-binding protein